MYEKFEHGVSLALLFMMGFMVVSSILELTVQIAVYTINSEGFFLDFKEFLHVFGYFLLILIALELMSSVRIRLHSNDSKIEIMFLIAITAMARKIVLMDSKTAEPLYLLGVAALVMSLSVGYYLVKRLATTNPLKQSLNPNNS